MPAPPALASRPTASLLTRELAPSPLPPPHPCRCPPGAGRAGAGGRRKPTMHAGSRGAPLPRPHARGERGCRAHTLHPLPACLPPPHVPNPGQPGCPCLSMSLLYVQEHTPTEHSVAARAVPQRLAVSIAALTHALPAPSPTPPPLPPRCMPRSLHRSPHRRLPPPPQASRAGRQATDKRACRRRGSGCGTLAHTARRVPLACAPVLPATVHHQPSCHGLGSAAAR